MYTSYISKLFVRIATSLKSREPSLPLFGELQTITIYDINILHSSFFLINKVKYQGHTLPDHFQQYFHNNVYVHSIFQQDKQVCSILHLLTAPEGSVL